ncbi:MAG: four helix bundle protein [Bacteroidota bacterium]
MKFENLRVWQDAVELSGLINDLTKTFPRDEVFVLTSQIKRASDSVSLNIAEGSTGQSNAEFKRFLGIALRSAIEVVGCLYLAKGRPYITDEQFNSLYKTINQLIISIQALRNSIK